MLTDFPALSALGLFAVVSFFVAASSGPTWVYVLSCAMSHGRAAAWFCVLGNLFGIGEKPNDGKFCYKDTLFTFTTENEIKKILDAIAVNVDITHSTTMRWEEDDHGSYRTGKHTHEACFFTVKRVD